MPVLIIESSIKVTPFQNFFRDISITLFTKKLRLSIITYIFNYLVKFVKGVVFMKISDTNENLIDNIEKLRKEMITIGMKNGFECSQVINISQKLDLLINEFQKQPNCLDSKLQRLA